MSNLNKLLAYSMCEEMEYNLFNDEECVFFGGLLCAKGKVQVKCDVSE